MRSKKVDFKNQKGEKLVARIELPLNKHPHNFALFAHCFTCNKNLTAVRNISSALTRAGFGVMRFDFTGLGESEGDFEDTNFSGNVEDLVDAASFLKREYLAPSVLIGHSLGGAAVIYAAKEINSVKAISTIGAPSNPQHVQNAFASYIDEINENGLAEVHLAGRPFTIKKQFLDDLVSNSTCDAARALKKPIAIFHSPQDETVGIENAKNIYEKAFHPKSFISLDGADHLLSNKDDSRYVGEVLASWAQRYITIPKDKAIDTDHQVAAKLGLDGYTTELQVGKHGFVADEPLEVGGNNFGPNPYEFVSSGLAACTAMTMKMYANRKKWKVREIEVHINHDKKHCVDCAESDNQQKKIDHFEREIKIEGDLDAKQVSRLLEIADRCPVHRTLHNEVKVNTVLIKS
ncbi:MAG: OsmC family protein [Bacteroidia bacterium]